MSSATTPETSDTLPPPRDSLVQLTIDDRYAVEALLGEGGMGRVYRARHVVLGKSLAIKVLRPEFSKNEESMERFVQEARSASSIGNQHIVDISDFGTLDDGSRYFVMEHLEGTDLTHAIDEAPGGMAEARAIHIVRQLADALCAAHAAGIIHRDLKPDNIFLISRGRDADFVKVVDFGLAKVGSATKKLTQAGRVFGTPHYMSPEQCAGHVVDARTDIYALGVILYEMLTGEWPFDADSVAELLSLHLFEAPPPPSSHNPSLSPALEAVVLRCLEKNADDRYATMAELEADLAALADGVVGPHVPSSGEFAAARPSIDPGRISGSAPTQRGDAFAATWSDAARRSAAEVAVGEFPEPAPERSSRLTIFAVALLALIAGVGIALFATRGDGGADVASRSDAPAAEESAAAVVGAPVDADDDSAALGLAEGLEGATSAAPAEGEATPSIRLTSSPDGADIFAGEVWVGRTPIDFPRPEERLAIEFRATGYVSQSFVLSPRTVASEVEVQLQPVPTPSRARRAPRPPRSEGESAAPAAARTPALTPGASLERIRNPWED